MHFADLSRQAAAFGTVRAIVGISAEFTPEGALSEADRAAQRADIKQTQNTLLAKLDQFNVTLVTQFESIPYITIEVDAAAIEYLKNSPLVTNVREDETVRLLLNESVPLIRAPGAWNRGFSGSGQAVAVLDTGTDYNHPFFALPNSGNKLIAEACFGTNNSSQGLSSLCPGGSTGTSVPGSGLHCTGISACEHGTHVAGIAVGSAPDINRFGVAKDANLIAIKVFSRFDNSGGVSLTATYTDINKGLQHVLNLRSSFSIASVNLSLGSVQLFPSYCDNFQPSTTALINNLRSYGIATVAGSGNDGNPSAIAYPACISSAVSVGATEDGSSGVAVDSVWEWSNSAGILNLLAPGRLITSSVPGGGYDSFAGTSMATPHVAGAWAVLKSRVPGASVDSVLNALSATGKPVFDPRNGLTKPRIIVDRALVALAPEPPRPFFDFDADRKSDISVFRPSDRTWYLLQSTAGFGAVQFGLPDDALAPGDYDGDGKTDVAVWRPSNGTWYVLGSRVGFRAQAWGTSGDKIAPADYDGDGITDFAVYRPSNNTWYIRQSSDNLIRYEYFGAAGDEPVSADYDGDGRADVAVFRSSNGTWYVQQSTAGFTAVQFGSPGDRTVQADYDADGRTDFAVFRASQSNPSDPAFWYMLKSSEGFSAVQFGVSNDLPAPGDYDGDGRADQAVFRPTNGTWYLLQSTLGFAGVQFGISEDRPVPGAYVRP